MVNTEQIRANLEHAFSSQDDEALKAAMISFAVGLLERLDNIEYQLESVTRVDEFGQRSIRTE